MTTIANRQLIMKNLASMKKQLLRRGVLEDNIAQVQVSELKNVKGF